MIMKKNVILTAMILTSALLFTACGSSDDVKRIEKDAPTQTDTSASENTDTTSSESTSAGAYTFSDQGVTVAVDDLMEPVLAKLGDPNEYFEAKSCAFEGLDKMYTYSHYEIDTYPSSDGDRISAIYLTDDLISTPEGLKIGSSLEDMEKLYGTGYEVSGTEYTYHAGDMSLKIQINGDKVSYITYASKVLGTVAQ
jgi:hypothetical protein